eukprot:7382114-Prymnesium_polylepis.3
MGAARMGTAQRRSRAPLSPPEPARGPSDTCTAPEPFASPARLPSRHRRSSRSQGGAAQPSGMPRAHDACAPAARLPRLPGTVPMGHVQHHRLAAVHALGAGTVRPLRRRRHGAVLV